MKKQLILAFLLLTSICVQAQYSSPNNTPFTLRDKEEKAADVRSELENKRFFKDTAFRMGELRTRKGLFTTELVYRFDQFERAIEVKMENGKTMLLNTKDILYCKVFYERDTAVFMPVAVSDAKKLTLLHVVYKTPTLQLYRDLHKTTMRKVDVYTDPYSDVRMTPQTAEVVHEYQYYIRKNNNSPLVKVKINPNSLSEVMPEKHNKIVSLFKGKENLTVSQVVHIMTKLDSPAVVQ